MSSAPAIWVLLDDRAGNNTQVLGVAERLGLPYGVLRLGYNAFAALPNLLLGRSLLHLSAASRKEVAERIGAAADQRIVILSAGRREAPVARWIKKRHPRAMLCHLMSPDAGWRDFDLIALPQHDRGAGLHRPLHTPSYARILHTALSPHGLTAEKLAAARAQWEPHFAHLSHPRIGVLLGGSSKHATFDAQDYALFGDSLQQAAQALKGSLILTTSRRTDAHGTDRIEEAVAALPHFLYRYGGRGENPYLGILACADLLAVSGDSISMLSEAASTGRPLYVWSPSALAPKYERFRCGLFELGVARPFALPLETGWAPNAAPDAAAQVASGIREMFEN